MDPMRNVGGSQRSKLMSNERRCRAIMCSRLNVISGYASERKHQRTDVFVNVDDEHTLSHASRLLSLIRESYMSRRRPVESRKREFKLLSTIVPNFNYTCIHLNTCKTYLRPDVSQLHTRAKQREIRYPTTLAKCSRRQRQVS